MNCGIMRVEKRKRADVYGIQIEANRTYDDYINGRDFNKSDIDWTLTNQNIHLVRTENWNEEITRQLKDADVKEVFRGNNRSVVLLDGLYTSSPEWFDTHTREEALNFFNKCLDFHKEHYCQGDSSRIINAVIHLDETTPHLAVASIPLINNGEKIKLCAKDIMGNKQDYHLRQEHFFDEVSQHFGMERGHVLDEGELKLHTTKREWQIATQEERLQKINSEVEIQEHKMETNNQVLEAQREVLENSPHILSPDELNRLAEIEITPNRITGNVSLPMKEYQSLLATKIEARNLRKLKTEVKEEREHLIKESNWLKNAKEDELKQAREEGLRQGLSEQKSLVLKAQGFDEMVNLILDEPKLRESLEDALRTRIKIYPKLTEALSTVFDWARNLKEEIERKISQKIHL